MARAREILTFAAIVAACGAPVALGQTSQPADGEPVIVGADRPQWRLIELQRLDAAFEIDYRDRRDTQSTTGFPDTTNSEAQLIPTLIFDFDAAIGHENLLDLFGQTRFELVQRWTDNPTLGGSDTTTDSQIFYDVNALFFKESQAPFTVYTFRDQQYLDRPFSSAIQDTINETGVRASLFMEKAPTFIHIFQNTDDQDNLDNDQDYSRRQNTVSLQNTLPFSPNHRLETSYTYDDISEDPRQSQKTSFTRNDLLLTDIINFGRDRHNEARTYLRWYDQSGDSAFSSLRLEEQIDMQHTETLQGRYNARANWVDVEGVDQDFVNGSATLIHQLFDSLVTTGTVGGDYFSTSEDFDSNSVFASISFDYTKIAGPGRIDAGYATGVNYQSNSEQGSDIDVFNDPKIYMDPAPITIDRRNVVNGSVMVTGPGGFPTYIEGVDYTVEYYPDRVEIYPILGGAISDGSLVLLDYTVGPEPASDIDTYSYSGSLRYTFTEGALRGLSLYGSYRDMDNDVSAVDPSLIPVNDVTTLIYGVEFRRDWLYLKAEQENNDSTQNPYDATRLQAIGEYLLGPGSRVSMEVNYEIQDFRQPDNQVNFFRVTGRWNQRWYRELSTLVRLDYRDEQDDLRGDSDGVDAIFSLQWDVRQTSVYGTFRTTLTGSDQTDTSSQYLEIGIRREF